MNKLILIFSSTLTSSGDRSDDAAQEAIRFVPNKQTLTVTSIRHEHSHVTIMPTTTIPIAEVAVLVAARVRLLLVLQ